MYFCFLFTWSKYNLHVNSFQFLTLPFNPPTPHRAFTFQVGHQLGFIVYLSQIIGHSRRPLKIRDWNTTYSVRDDAPRLDVGLTGDSEIYAILSGCFTPMLKVNSYNPCLDQFQACYIIFKNARVSTCLKNHWLLRKSWF